MAQSLSAILIHVIFSTKQRQRFIQPDVLPDLHRYMVGIARSHKAYVHEIGGIEDHVHLLISLPRTLSISKLVEDVKKSSSKWIKTKGGIYQDFAWQSGYGALSIGQSGMDGLKNYIQNQREHHQKVSFQDEYRLLLKKYGVAFDEKYVWD
ncbi:IS200/IS605 family transposase [Simkania negevensis]|uniref:IS200/IS605 family transposase n=1 Tax=Simkania negevensis TaxID=83561 RepID=A0ABS3APK8_9BACT|nr:IS200/IS605 family transposase [Simkania negevensis]